MNAAQIEDLVNRGEVTYRDWDFRAVSFDDEVNVRGTLHNVIDSGDGYRMRNFDTAFVIEADDNPSLPAVLRRFERGIEMTETHERREFLRYRGIAVFHPHRADGQDRYWRETANESHKVHADITGSRPGNGGPYGHD